MSELSSTFAYSTMIASLSSTNFKIVRKDWHRLDPLDISA